MGDPILNGPTDTPDRGARPLNGYVASCARTIEFVEDQPTPPDAPPITVTAGIRINNGPTIPYRGPWSVVGSSGDGVIVTVRAEINDVRTEQVEGGTSVYWHGYSLLTPHGTVAAIQSATDVTDLRFYVSQVHVGQSSAVRAALQVLADAASQYLYEDASPETRADLRARLGRAEYAARDVLIPPGQTIQELIEASSPGTPEAAAARARVPVEEARAVVAQAAALAKGRADKEGR
jgi:hypothetical protein